MILSSSRWSVEALKHLRPNIHPRIIIDVLRNASKACVIKRKFQKAGLLSKQAVYLAREIFGDKHPKYSDVLFIYGFYLLNFDCALHSVNVYKKGLEIRRAIYGKSNLYVAAAHEDLAYALYVLEYNSGKFGEARYNESRHEENFIFFPGNECILWQKNTMEK